MAATLENMIQDENEGIHKSGSALYVFIQNILPYRWMTQNLTNYNKKELSMVSNAYETRSLILPDDTRGWKIFCNEEFSISVPQV